ncbi:MAG: hypothetical protein ACFFD4_02480 [Candidatus Odinarchaeota archaeon]
MMGTAKYNFTEMLLDSGELFDQILTNYFNKHGLRAKVTWEHNRPYSETLGRDVHNLQIVHHPDDGKEVAKLMANCCPFSYSLKPEKTEPVIKNAVKRCFLCGHSNVNRETCLNCGRKLK